MSKSTVFHFSQSKIHSSPMNSESATVRRQIITYLRPSICTCRLFGVFPFVVTENENLKKFVLKANRKWWLLYSILIFCITTVYMVFQAGSLMVSVGKGHTIVQLVAQSIWINAALVPYITSIFMMASAHKIVGIFQAWCKIEMELAALFCHMKTKQHVRKFRASYFKLAFISISACGYHVLVAPHTPVYPFYYYNQISNSTTGVENVLDEWIQHAAYSVVQMIIIGWKWAGIAALEGLCCLFSTVFIQCMESVMEGLEYVLNEAKEPGIDETIKTLLNKSYNKEAYHSSHETRGKSSDPTTTPFHNYKGKGKAIACTMSPDEYLLFAIRNLQTFSSLQTHINSVVGPLLLLDFGQLVIMTCALTFLPIIFAKTLDYASIVVFVANWLCVMSRLVIIIMCLGNVFTKGQEVNVGLAKAMNSCHLSPQSQSSVLAYLTVFSSNPVSFTAWGFFPITRGTLLAAFSLISTYAVVFLQLNNT